MHLKTKEADGLLKEALTQLRRIFKYLADNSFAKQPILSTVGSISKASLRDEIYHFADKIIAVAGDKFPASYLQCH